MEEESWVARWHQDGTLAPTQGPWRDSRKVMTSGHRLVTQIRHMKAPPILSHLYGFGQELLRNAFLPAIAASVERSVERDCCLAWLDASLTRKLYKAIVTSLPGIA